MDNFVELKYRNSWIGLEERLLNISLSDWYKLENYWPCFETQYQNLVRHDDPGISPLAPFQEFVQTFFGLTSFVCIADDLITNFHLGCQCSLMIEEAEIPKVRASFLYC